jgi:hypothetical protein
MPSRHPVGDDSRKNVVSVEQREPLARALDLDNHAAPLELPAKCLRKLFGGNDDEGSPAWRPASK